MRGPFLFISLTAGSGLLVVVISRLFALGEGAVTALRLPVVFLPVIVAVALVQAEQGEAGLRALLRRMLRWRVSPLWWLAAVSIYPAVATAVCLWRQEFEGVPFRLREDVDLTLILPILAITFIIPGITEETGWRGYLQPALGRALPPYLASLIVGITWGVWHSIDVVLDPERFAASSYLWKFLWIVAASVLFGWIQDRSKSGLLAIVGHQSALLAFALLPLHADMAGDFRSYELTALAMCASAGLIAILHAFQYHRSS